jgi:hypothetical protein
MNYIYAPIAGVALFGTALMSTVLGYHITFPLMILFTLAASLFSLPEIQKISVGTKGFTFDRAERDATTTSAPPQQRPDIQNGRKKGWAGIVTLSLLLVSWITFLITMSSKE